MFGRLLYHPLSVNIRSVRNAGLEFGNILQWWEVQS